MQLGPLRINITSGPPYGVWMRKNNGPEQDVTGYAVAVVVLAVVVFCCCVGRIF